MTWELKNALRAVACVALSVTLSALPVHAESRKRKKTADTLAAEKRKSTPRKAKVQPVPKSLRVIVIVRLKHG